MILRPLRTAGHLLIGPACPRRATGATLRKPLRTSIEATNPAGAAPQAPAKRHSGNSDSRQRDRTRGPLDPSARERWRISTSLTWAGMDHALVTLHSFPDAQLGMARYHRRLAGPPRACSPSICEAGDLRPDAETATCSRWRTASSALCALGVASFSVAGMGISGTVAWMISALAPLELRSVAVLSAHSGVQPVIGRAPWAEWPVTAGAPRTAHRA